MELGLNASLHPWQHDPASLVVVRLADKADTSWFQKSKLRYLPTGCTFLSHPPQPTSFVFQHSCKWWELCLGLDPHMCWISHMNRPLMTAHGFGWGFIKYRLVLDEDWSNTGWIWASPGWHHRQHSGSRISTCRCWLCDGVYLPLKSRQTTDA